MRKNNHVRLFITGVFTLLIALSFAKTTKADDGTVIPDISEWQGKLSATKVQNLKSQVSFIINRRQYGAGYQDKYATNNTNLYTQYGVPFGEYDYATFNSKAAAKNEANIFYANSNKNAKFYVLDFEENDVTSGSANSAVKAWYKQMRKLTDKKLIFYSYQAFATQNANSARKKFDAQWIANYSYRPTIKTDLWQYSNKKYVPALKRSVDASTILSSDKPISWWIGGQSAATDQTQLETTATSSYYEDVPTQITATKKVYEYNKSKFKAVNRVTTIQPGTTLSITGIKQRSTGSYYFVTADGYFVTANKSYVQE
ncbi:GH25 family lysozyme [Lentilactobacillus sp. Marseille-Q4993]|uniref:GH25 family lysozyme n=1 Tax=Lentilactobacillus sp. Marseille-Q4993 TaxID=3039492 RepID=UPI0024BD55DE|nr:GH25 family lysozyme [Lentilactobacillus sp. Marseille-Q4993]